MKEEVVRNARIWGVSAVFLAGLLYAVSALMIAKPVYASSCDCAEELQDANEYCKANFGSTAYALALQCPTGSGNNEVSFRCNPGFVGPIEYPCGSD